MVLDWVVSCKGKMKEEARLNLISMVGIALFGEIPTALLVLGTSRVLGGFVATNLKDWNVNSRWKVPKTVS